MASSAMSSPTASSNASGSAPNSTPYQDALLDFCRKNNARMPTFQIVSDRRGGRTAWSCTCIIQGQHIAARFWYDGQYVHNAREDAAERALQMLGQLPTPAGPQPAHLQQQSQRYFGAIST